MKTKQPKTLYGWEWIHYRAVITAAFLISALAVLAITVERAKRASLEPLGQMIGTEETVTPTPTSRPSIRTGRRWQGIASYYSRSGCLGCSPTLTMANGQPLDDDALTVAFNKLPLGSKVRVTNAKSMFTVVATVTDRGGFERLGRIIDITPKVKRRLNCPDLCDVIVEEEL